MTRKKRREMEVYDKKSGKWIRVNSKNFSDRIMKIYDYMTAEMQILDRINMMNERLGIKADKEDE